MTFGHNHPPEDANPLLDRLAEENQALIDRAGTLQADESRIPDALSDETAGRATDFARQISACIKKAEEARKEAKQPFLDAGRQVDGWFGGVLTEPLRSLLERVQARVTTYLRAKEVAERKAREAEARRLADEAQKLGKTGDTGTAREVLAESRAARIEAQTAKPADLVRTHTAMGGTATLKAPWVHEIVDRAKLDLETLRPHLATDALDKAVRAFIRAGGRELAGARIYQDRKASIR